MLRIGPAGQDAADGRGDGGIDERFEGIFVAAVGVFGADLSEVIAGSFDDGAGGAGAGAVELNFAGVKEPMEAAGDHGVQQGELVGVVVVEGGAVDGGPFGDVLDGDFFETLRLHEGAQGSLEKLPGAADAWIANFAVGDGHRSIHYQSTKRKIPQRF